LEIDADDTRLLFKLLDRDDSGVIDVEEFCEGCMRLKGEAKALDVHTLIWQVSKFLGKWGDFTEYVEEHFVDVDRFLAGQLKRDGVMVPHGLQDRISS